MGKELKYRDRYLEQQISIGTTERHAGMGEAIAMDKHVVALAKRLVKLHTSDECTFFENRRWASKWIGGKH
ncbi:hypothetical protein V3C99_007510 [Haemonchus contortus]